MNDFQPKPPMPRRAYVAVALAAALLLSACAPAATPAALESPLAAPEAPATTTEPTLEAMPADLPRATPPALNSPLQLETPVSVDLANPAGSVAPVARDAASQAAALQNPAVQASVDALAKVLNGAPDTIVVLGVESVEWPDGCLGVRQPDVMCTMMIVPGFQVVLESGGQQYDYHTNSSGSNVVLASPR